MFQLTNTFSKGALSLTPVLMGETPLFFPQELEEALAYTNLARNVLKVEYLIQDIDYLSFDEGACQQIRALLNGGKLLTPVKKLYDRLQKIHNITLLTESGLYTLLCRSIKPEALQFRIWVTSEVLPSIRKTGSYGTYSNSEHSLLYLLAQNQALIIELLKPRKRQPKAPAPVEPEETPPAPAEPKLSPAPVRAPEPEPWHPKNEQYILPDAFPVPIDSVFGQLLSVCKDLSLPYLSFRPERTGPFTLAWPLQAVAATLSIPIDELNPAVLSPTPDRYQVRYLYLNGTKNKRHFQPAMYIR